MFWSQFSYLCKCAGKSPNAIASELGISSGSITAWRKGALPRNSTLKKLTQYFGVTEEFLLYGTKHFGLVSENFPQLLSPIALREQPDDPSIKKDTTVSSDVGMPEGYAQLTPANREIVDRLIADLAKAQSKP